MYGCAFCIIYARCLIRACFLSVSGELESLGCSVGRRGWLVWYEGFEVCGVVGLSGVVLNFF